MPWWIVENTLLAAMLALLVALVSRARRVPPVVRHGLWLVVLIKLIVPPVFSLGVTFPMRSIASEQIARQSGQQEVYESFASANRNASVEASMEPPTETNSPQIGARPPLAGSNAIDVFPENEAALSSSGPLEAFVPVDDPTTTMMMETESLQALSAALATTGEHSTVPADSQRIQPRIAGAPIVRAVSPFSFASVTKLLPWAALAGTLVVTFIQVVRLVRLRRMLNRALCAPPDFTALVVDLSAQLGVRPPAVRLSTDIRSPLVCAFGPAVLVWPASRLASLRESARRAVIVHELAHLARRDHWIGWIELAASCAWWWNPLFWYVRHQLHENAELACDAWVTGLFPEARRAYAGALIDLAELDSLETATVPALGVGDGSRKLFERRLVMIMGERVRYQMGAVGFIGMGLLALVALPGCSAGLADEQPALADEPFVQNVEVAVPAAALSDPSDENADPFANRSAALDQDLASEPTAPSVETLPVTPPVITFEGEVRSLPDAARAEDLPTVSNDDRLKRLEDRFEALLTELRALKSGDTTRNRKGMPMMGPAGQNMISAPPTPGARPSRSKPTSLGTPSSNTGLASGLEGPVDEVTVTLTRATYKLHSRKAADEVAAFFKGNLTDEIEVRVTDQMLVVTASAKDLAAISSFIRLLQTRGAPATKAKVSDEIRGARSGTAKDNWRENPANGNRGDDAPDVAPTPERPKAF